jgi:hypothetical protein
MLYVVIAFLSIAALSAAGVLFAASRALKKDGPERPPRDGTVTLISVSRPPQPAHMSARIAKTLASGASR